MPVQHGDDGVLRAMRRAVTARRMEEIVAAFRDAIPSVTVRTTVLVGFPGETERAFDNLLAFVEDVAFDRLGVFTYSAEDGTPALAMPDHVPADVMAERAALVQEASGPSPLPMPPPNSTTTSMPASIAAFRQSTHFTGLNS